MRHPLDMMKDDEAKEAEKSRTALRSFGPQKVYPLCFGCKHCNCPRGLYCVFGPGTQGDGVAFLEDHLIYAMGKGNPCDMVVVCLDRNGRESECPCCCKDFEDLIFHKSSESEMSAEQEVPHGSD